MQVPENLPLSSKMKNIISDLGLSHTKTFLHYSSTFLKSVQVAFRIWLIAYLSVCTTVF